MGNEVTIMAGLSVLVTGFSIFTIEVLVMLLAFNGLSVIPALLKLCAFSAVLCSVVVEEWLTTLENSVESSVVEFKRGDEVVGREMGRLFSVV